MKDREDYQPFGKRLSAEPASPTTDPKRHNTTGYTGHLEDRELGLTYMQARWYNPEIGRFMAPDPVGFVDSNLQSFNRYVYVNNNPYKYVDPDGKFAILANPYFWLALGAASGYVAVNSGNSSTSLPIHNNSLSGSGGFRSDTLFKWRKGSPGLELGSMDEFRFG